MVEPLSTYTSSRASVSLRLSAWFLVSASACVAGIDTPRPLDDRVTTLEEATPPPGAVVQVPQPTLILFFSDAIDPRRSALERAVALSQGQLNVPVRVSVDPRARSLIAVPVDPLVPSLRYTWEVDDTQLRGAGGRPVQTIETRTFVVAADAVPRETPDATAPTWAAVEALLRTHCAGCHDDRPLDALGYERLLGRSGQHDGRRLVEPFAPARSYLIEKVLPEYPDRMGAEMPPPWAESQLSAAEIDLLYAWIAAGANR